MGAGRKKLIEVSLPLEAVNAASVREKSIRHGHPSTLHLWWARRPLAACRAVLFAQLVDDPSAWPEVFPGPEDQRRERKRLHQIIERLVTWEATGDERVLGEARREIARSLARGRGESAPQGDAAVLSYLGTHAPPVCDPFCGGGSIPLEAQRLGLRAHGSDLNPVAVLISKATCEIPPRFSGCPPVNPDRDPHVAWKGARGLAEDIRYYGRWMRGEAAARIGHLYPKVRVTEEMVAEREDLAPYEAQNLTVIAWLWARTVASPDPRMRGVHVPLASSFVLSSKKNRQAVVAPAVDREGRRYRFAVKAGAVGEDELAAAKSGTKAARGANFTCLISGAPIPEDHVKAESMAGRMGAKLMAVVAEGKRGRVYLDPSEDMEQVARKAEPEWRPDGDVPERLTGGTCYGYGLTTFADLFTSRQLTALGTFSDLVGAARAHVRADALAAGMDADGPRLAAGMDADGPRLAAGGAGADAYADAVATYLGLGVSKISNTCSTITSWMSDRGAFRETFARQAIPMIWDYAESNPFSSAGGCFDTVFDKICRFVAETTSRGPQPAIIQRDAAADTTLAMGAVIATDPPYYDNIPYADISDFFYLWQRRCLRDVWPDLFRRVLTPKDEELVALAYRHGGRKEAERFFMDGMAKALGNMRASGTSDFPVTIYYAFKQSEAAKDGLTSPGWAAFLHGLAAAGYVIDGTWPVKTESSGRSIGQSSNALASSIVLVCRKRAEGAETMTRRDFTERLRADLPDALAKIRDGGVGPVDMAQAAIGPGMGVFTAARAVLEPDDTPMTVRDAIALINRVRDEISGEEEAGYDADTRFCIDWFEAVGMDEVTAGEAITMAQAYNIGIDDLETAGVFSARGGRARLLRREELPREWSPATDKRLTVWECAQHLARVLEAPDGGGEAAARLYAEMDAARRDAAHLLAYRLYDICERKGRAAEAQVWNMLAHEWTSLDEAVPDIRPDARDGLLPLDMPPHP